MQKQLTKWISYDNNNNQTQTYNFSYPDSTDVHSLVVKLDKDNSRSKYPYLLFKINSFYYIKSSPDQLSLVYTKANNILT